MNKKIDMLREAQHETVNERQLVAVQANVATHR